MESVDSIRSTDNTEHGIQMYNMKPKEYGKNNGLGSGSISKALKCQ
jgi:hypothetical protein